MITHNFEEVRTAYLGAYAVNPFFDTWIPREKFLEAEIDGAGNFAISREDDGIYGIALGGSPTIPSNWKNFSIESKGINSLPKEFKVVAEWDCYWAPSRVGEITSDNASDLEIKNFLGEHAPHSSVFPGNEEIQRWISIRREGELAGVAAICKWESGELVLSSVATHTHYRGQGIGRKLMESALAIAEQLGFKNLSLGVMHSNIAAHRLYQASGFTLMHNFSYCERR